MQKQNIIFMKIFESEFLTRGLGNSGFSMKIFDSKLLNSLRANHYQTPKIRNILAQLFIRNRTRTAGRINYSPGIFSRYFLGIFTRKYKKTLIGLVAPRSAIGNRSRKRKILPLTCDRLLSFQIYKNNVGLDTLFQRYCISNVKAVIKRILRRFMAKKRTVEFKTRTRSARYTSFPFQEVINARRWSFENHESA